MSDNLDMREVPPLTVDGKPIGSFRQVDPDTYVTDGVTRRLKGFNAPEVPHMRAGVFTPGALVNDTTQQKVNMVASVGGYTKLVDEGKDKYGRVITDQQNPRTGEGLGDTLTKLGVQDITPFTPNNVIADNQSIQAFGAMFPALAAKDPLIKAAMNADKPQYAARIEVPKAVDYASFKRAIGVGAAAEEEKEIARLSTILEDTSLRPELRNKLSKQLEAAKARLYEATTTPDVVGGVMIDQKDRSIMDESRNQFSDKLYSAWLDTQKQMGGILEMAGEGAKWDWLKERAKSAQRNINYEQTLMPNTLDSISEVRTDNTWNTVKDTSTYVTNLFAGTLPSMAILLASAASTGGLAPAASFGLSTLPPSAMYAGGFYANQPDDKKNAGMAISLGLASGVFDRVGLEGMMGSNLLTVVGRKEITDAIIKKELATTGKVLTTKEAENILEAATKKELVELSTAGAEFAAKQIASKEAAARGIGALMLASGSEVGTETLQQLAEMAANTGEWNTDFKYERNFYNHLMDAAIGGGAMGGTIQGIGSLKDAAQWHSIADSFKPNERERTESQRYQANNQETTQFVSVQDAARKISSMGEETAGYDNLLALPSESGAWNAAKAIVMSPGKLVRRLNDSMVPSIIKEDGSVKTYLGVLKAITGGVGILPGDNAVTGKQRMIGRWHIPSAESLLARMGTNTAVVNDLLKQAHQMYWSKDLNLPPEFPQAKVLEAWRDEAETVRAIMKHDMTQAEVDTSSVEDLNSLFNTAFVNPQLVRENAPALVNRMVESGFSRRVAKQVIDAFVGDNKVEAQNARTSMQQVGIFSDPNFNKIFEGNVFTNIENIKDRAATDVINETMLGRDGSKLAKLVYLADKNKEFESEAEKKNTIKELQDWYKIHTGQYHPLDEHPNLKKFLSLTTTLTMLATLSKAALSSQVEVAMATLGTPGHLIKKQVAEYTKAYATEYASDVNKMNSYGLGKIGIAYIRQTPHTRYQAEVDKLESKLEDPSISVEENIKIQNRIEEIYKDLTKYSLFERLGFNETGYNTQSKFEYQDTSARTAMHIFSSLISLRAQTDANRIALLSIAGDTVLGKMRELMAIPKEQRLQAFTTGEGLSKGQAQSLLELQQYGMNVFSSIDKLDRFTNIDAMSQYTSNGTSIDSWSLLQNFNVADESLSPEGKEQLEAMRSFQNEMYTILGNFVDARITNPQSHNMPKYFHDPRLRVLTVMGRFMAAAHANILPRLYKQYIINGNAGMRYGAFSTVVMALFTAAMMNQLKDLLSYGTDESPYIKDNRKKVQRTLYASGLLGQYERLIDKAMPLYPQSSVSLAKDPIGAISNAAKDISPVVSWAARPLDGLKDIANDKIEKGTYQVLRGAPVIGSFPVVSKDIANLITQ